MDGFVRVKLKLVNRLLYGVAFAVMMKILSLLVATLLSFSVHADSCFSPSPGKQRGDIYAAQQAPSLTAKQREQLDGFLSGLIRRDRDGKSAGYFCKQKEGEVEDNYDLALRPQQLKKGQYELRVQLSSRNRSTSEERIRYSLGADKLYLGLNERGPEVVVIEQSRTELKVLERYRRRVGSGASIVRETLRHYKISGKSLTVDNRYYSNGVMISENRWYF